MRASGVRANSVRMKVKTPVYVAGFDRGVRPIGDWSMSMTLSMCWAPSMRSCAPRTGRARALAQEEDPQVVEEIELALSEAEGAALAEARSVGENCTAP